MLTRVAVWLARLVVGGTFVVSGMTKMIDLHGSINKFNDYFAAWGMTDTFPEGLVLLAAAALALAEFLTGFTLATGSMRRTSAFCASAIMAIMLPLSAYIRIASPVDDCGCFGDWLIISNSATFWKNVGLSALCVFLLLRNRRAGCLFAPWIQWVQIVVAAAYCAFIGMVGYDEQPLLDFRPYPVGSYLTDNASDDLAQTYVYRRIADGALLEFSAYDLPDDDSGLEFIEVKEHASASADSERIFIILDPETGAELTDEIVGAEPEQLFLLIPDLKAAGVGISYNANELAARTSLIALTDATPEEIAEWRDLSMADYPIYAADGRTLKTIARGKTALVMTHRGQIRWKRTLQSVNPEVTSLSDYETPTGPKRFSLYSVIFLCAQVALCLLGAIPRMTAKRFTHKKRRTDNEHTVPSQDSVPSQDASPSQQDANS